ncbi:MAG: hypothetical protein JSU68_11630 [Phycisphaerales bacterium]|nr:MAG: hypothetical protein JSU68_11630 [Phycisphaerales bacterium]
MSLLIVTVSATAQEAAQQSKVGGEITQDTVWRGQVTVDRDIIISGATLTIESGTRVSFSPTETTAARIILDGGREAPAVLRIEGTAERPVLLTTEPGKPPGSIIVPAASSRHWRDRKPMATAHGSILASHTTFQGLGETTPSAQGISGRGPAIHLQLTDPTDELKLTASRFRSCGPVMANFVDDKCSVVIHGCSFEESLDSVAVRLYGSGRGPRVFEGNRADAAFQVLAGPAWFTDNVLIGPHACLAVAGPEAGESRIQSNYVHSSGDQDDGRFCLDCSAADAVVEGNVLRGGTWVIQRTGTALRGNVLAGRDGLLSKSLGIRTTTHHLIASLPAGAQVLDNVLLGPSYSHLATSEGCRGVLVRNNVFDGGGISGRAVHLNTLAREAVAARVESNVFAGFKDVAVYDEARLPDAVQVCRRNVIAETPRACDLAVEVCKEWGETTREALGYPSPSAIDWGDIEAQLLAGERTVAEVIGSIKARYPLPQGSP